MGRKFFGTDGIRGRTNEAPMTADAVFDLASLTKPIVTALSIMLLIERFCAAKEDDVDESTPNQDANSESA